MTYNIRTTSATSATSASIATLIASVALVVLATVALASPLEAQASTSPVMAVAPTPLALSAVPTPPPAVAPALRPYIGEYAGNYATAADTQIVAEVNGTLVAFSGHGNRAVVPDRDFTRVNGSLQLLVAAGQPLVRFAVGTEEGVTFRVKPLRPIAELRRTALAAKPPAETGKRAPELVELVVRDSTIHLDIRYATDNNFMGAAMYSQGRAFLQRPAAEAVVRANRTLKAFGFGLLIHDAYRPWYVTKMFWDATTGADHEFVANPATGSKHNRGAAVDLTLYTLADGKPVRMPGGYDEFSHRSYPSYPGGTSLERWRRDLLRAVMESEGFSVNPSEWWHFDLTGWAEWPIGNIPFEQVGRRP